MVHGKYKVPYTDLAGQYRKLKKDIFAAMEKVFASGDFILRDEVRCFEKAMASFLGVDYIIGVNSGTDALYLSLLTAGIHHGDEVITVSHTFVATVAVIIHCGALPVFVDISKDYNMDTSQIENAITPRTRAIIAVHLNGRLCNMDKISELAKKHHLIVIEDAAQALGASFKGKQAGSFGLTGCFSVHPLKNLSAAGDGGFISTNNKDLAEKITLLRNHGQKSKEELLYFGFNSRLDNLQAAILNVKLPYLDGWIKRRRAVAQMYHHRLSEISQLHIPAFSEETHYDVYSSYVIRAEKRDRLAEYLRKNGIEVFIHWPCALHLQKNLNLCRCSLPETEKASKEVLSLPINAEIEDKQVNFTADCIYNFYKYK